MTEKNDKAVHKKHGFIDYAIFILLIFISLFITNIVLYYIKLL